MKKPLLYVITDVEIQDRFSHVELAKAAVDGGADILQLRDKKRADQELLPIAREIRELCGKAGIVFLLNDRVEVALAADADGVHLGQEDLPIAEARKKLGSQKLIGATAGSLEEVLRAQSQGADYVGFGHIFPTASKLKTGEPKGTAELARVCKQVGLPVIAIGGIDSENLPGVMESGAAGAAIIRAVCRAEDPAEAVRILKRVMSRKRVAS